MVASPACDPHCVHLITCRQEGPAETRDLRGGMGVASHQIPLSRD